ncbi:hypothetical protein BSU04_29890 [Caballeronia sordidicola]|uniref:Uncharacterized protein n=1 Tax=Caballeronia sordidicola TaxID=196367 RepID=A0A226WUL8_CABSO|nr:hypothetical protein BSU04_29890 [Caballeronia sordidicola]
MGGLRPLRVPFQMLHSQAQKLTDIGWFGQVKIGAGMRVGVAR